MFEPQKVSSSPYINRFLSADTIVPNPTNPQHLNRYSYVTNNPLRYTDPTGHMQIQDGSQQDNFSQSVFDDYVPLPDPEDDDDENDDNTPDWQYCQPRTLSCWANLTQDLATGFDFFGALLEVAVVPASCVLGPEGCGGGLLIVWTLWNAGPNQVETALSGLSLLITAVDDYSDGELGESTATSFTTFVVGGMSPDPIADLIIDGYASGYNHGFFNGIVTIMNGESILQSP